MEIDPLTNESLQTPEELKAELLRELERIDRQRAYILEMLEKL